MLSTEQVFEALSKVPPVEISALLLQLMTHIAQCFDAEDSQLFLYSEPQQSLFTVIRDNDQLQEVYLALNQGLAGQVMQTGQTINIADVVQNDLISQLTGVLRTKPIRNLLCTPLTNPQQQRIGVVQVFNRETVFSTTEEQRLQELARQTAITIENAQYYQQLHQLTQLLQTEYRQLQTTAQRLADDQLILQDKVKRGQRLRRLLVTLVIVTGLAISWQNWSEAVIASLEPKSPTTSSPHEAVANKTIKVAQRPIQVILTLMGKIEPLNQIEVVSPLEGKVKEKHFQYNQFAKQGQTLLVIDTSSEELKRQDKQAEYIEVVKKVEKLRNWLHSSEVASAQRDLTKFQRNMALTERTLQETRRLFEQGIIAAQDVEKEEEGYHSLQLDYQSQQEKFKDLLEEGSKEKVQIAELKMEVARASLEEVKTRIQNARLVTPIAGVVLLPEGSKKADDGVQEIQEGSMVKQNQVLFVIANMDGFTINAKVDELDILKLEIGQKATITGEAFRNITLEGKISSISSRADKEDDGPREESSTSEFAITIAVSKLTADQKKQLRLGMSTEMKIFLYEKKNALVVPFDAVTIKNKDAWVTVQDQKTGTPKEVKVKLGQTLIDGALEILEGLEASDELLPRVIEPDTEEDENL